MDFRLTPEQEQLRDTARRIARAELPALAKKLEETNEPVPKAMVKQYGALGFLGVNLPEAFGGHGADRFDDARHRARRRNPHQREKRRCSSAAATRR